MVPLIPLGEIDGDDRASGGVHRLDRRAGVPGHRTIEPGAEQGIDDDGGAGEIGRRGDRPAPSAGRPGRIALELVERPDQAQPHAVSGRRQVASRDETIAAIVAGTGHDGHPAARRMTPGDGLRDRGAGVLHEGGAGNTGSDGPAVRLPHLVIGEEFDHRRHATASQPDNELQKGC